MGTKIHGKQIRVLVDEFDWSCMLNSANISGSRDLVDATTYCLSSDPNGATQAKEYVPGLMGTRVSTRGVGLEADPNTLAIRPWTTFDSSILANLGIHTSNAKGALAHEFEARIQSQPREFPVAGVNGVSSEWQADNWVYGKVLSGGQNITASGALVGEKLEGPDVTDKILTGRSIVSVFRLVKITGVGTFAAKVQHSTDSTNGTDGIWADIATHASGTLSAIGDLRVETVAGSDLGPWFRLNVTTYTGFTSVICRASTGILLV